MIYYNIFENSHILIHSLGDNPSIFFECVLYNTFIAENLWSCNTADNLYYSYFFFART